MQVAAHSFAVCLHDANEWTRASRLRLNPTLLAHVASLCRTGYYQLRQLRPLVQSMTAEAARIVGWTIVIRCSTVSRTGHSTAQVAVCAERHCTTYHWHAMSWSYHAGTTRTPLATHPTACQVQSGMSCSPVAVRAGASLRLLPLVFYSTRRSLCDQLTFRLAWCCEHSAITATELLQPLDLVCGALFRSSSAIHTSPYGLFRQQLKGHLFLGSMNTALCDFWYAVL